LFGLSHNKRPETSSWAPAANLYPGPH